MKIRSSHIAIVIVVSLFGFIVFVLLRDGSGGGGTGNPDEDFLASVRNSSTSAPVDLSLQATVPPEGVALSSGPQIVFPEGDIHLGTIPNDDFGHIEVPIRNDGESALFIRNITTSCACTMGEMVDGVDTIEPGKTALLKVSVNPFRVPGFHSEKTLTLICNDPTTTALERRVVADVDPEYFIETDKLDFGTFQKGEKVERRIRIRQLYDTFPLKDVRLSFISQLKTGTPIPGLNYEVVPVPETEWSTAGLAEYDLLFSVDENVASGPFKGVVFLYVDLKRFKAMGIYIDGNAESV